MTFVIVFLLAMLSVWWDVQHWFGFLAICAALVAIVAYLVWRDPLVGQIAGCLGVSISGMLVGWNVAQRPLRRPRSRAREVQD